MYGPLGFKQPPPRWLGGFSQPGPLGGGTIQGAGAAPGPSPLGGFQKPPAMPGASVGQPVNRYLGGFGRPGALPGYANGGVATGPSIVGERGPELLFPGNKSATVVPLPGGGAPAPLPGPRPIGGGRPIGSPPEPGVMKGLWGGGGFARMPGSFYEPNPNAGWGDPPMRRVYGAANTLARLVGSGFRFKNNPGFQFSQADADRMTQQAMADMARDYANGTMDPAARRQYEELLARGPGQSAWADFLYDPNQSTGGQSGPWDPFAFSTSIDPDAAEAQTRAADSYYERVMQQYEPLYTTPPYASGKLGEELSPAQRRADWEALRAWYRKRGLPDPDPIYDDSMGAT